MSDQTSPDTAQKVLIDLASEQPLEWRKNGPSSEAFCRFCGGRSGDVQPHFSKCVWNRAQLLVQATIQ